MFLISTPSHSPNLNLKPQTIIPFAETSPAFGWRATRPERLPDLQRHWCPESEVYAGVDALFTALDRGWRIASKIQRESYFLSKGREGIIFHFELLRDGERMRMPVLSNPCLQRLLEKRAVMVLGN